jgi:microsomal dipeptidase-like Zn-dependent dipeptidase
VAAVPNISRDDQPIQFRVNLSQAAPIQLTLYSLMGEKVAQLMAEGNPGVTTLAWGLTNQSGSSAASGLYFYIVNAGGLTQMGKVVVLH